jgi:hypothetical protein
VRTGPKAEPRIRQQKVERSNGKQKGARKRQKGARKKQKGKKMEIGRPVGYIIGY